MNLGQHENDSPAQSFPGQIMSRKAGYIWLGKTGFRHKKIGPTINAQVYNRYELDKARNRLERAHATIYIMVRTCTISQSLNVHR